MTEPYTLPDLNYDYAALEPHISGRIMELHHARHHAAYVKGANQALEQLDAWRPGDGGLSLLEKNLAFHVSGHVLHSLLWTNLDPSGGGDPEDDLAEEIGSRFGDAATFRAQMTDAAAGVQGSGWAVAAWEPAADRLVVQQVYDHQGNLAHGAIPLLVIDAWEHAYYLQYLNDKTAYLDAVWRVVNWADVAQRLMAARSRGVNS